MSETWSKIGLWWRMLVYGARYDRMSIEQAMYQSGIDEGIKRGYQAGHVAGYDRGVSSGYERGHKAGMRDAYSKLAKP